MSYDYTRYVLRTDPTCPPSAATADLGGQDVDLAAAMIGEFDATAPVIAGIWQQLTPGTVALEEMLAVTQAFTRFATRRGLRTWQAIPTKVIRDFICLPDPLITDSARKLRKNAVHGAYLALTDAALFDATSPARGIHPAPPPTRRAAPRAGRAPVHLRSATHDEILLIRLACRLAGTGRTQHLPAAAVALCTSAATTSEAAQVCWKDLASDAAVTFAGRPAATPGSEKLIAARTVPLDPWAAQALAAWRTERSAHRPVDPGASMLYGGNQMLTSNTAQACTDRQIAKAMDLADLRDQPGLTAGSLRLWAAARNITTLATLIEGAALAGVDPLTLRRHLTAPGDHPWRNLDAA